jgi:hypothetical protein
VIDPDGLKDSDEVILTVTPVNDAPQITSTPVTVATQGKEYLYEVKAADPDAGDTLIYSFEKAPSFLNINKKTGKISGLPQNKDVGEYDIKVVVTDSSGASVNQEYQLAVLNTNDAPQIEDIPDLTIAEGENFSVLFLDSLVIDPDNSPEQLSWSVTESSYFDIVIDNRIASIAVRDTNWNGQDTLTFTVTDPAGSSDTKEVVLTVTPVNDAPQITSAPLTELFQGEIYQYRVTATDVDDSDSLFFVLETAPAFLSIDNLSGLITGVPGSGDVGIHSISISVIDLAGAKAVQSFLLTVNNVNDPPRISSTSNISFNEDDTLSYPLSRWYSAAGDPDIPDSLLSFRIIDSLSTVKTTYKKGQYLFYAPLNWWGKDTLILVVSDGIECDSSEIYVSVKPVNDAPQIINIPESWELQPESSNRLLIWDYVEDIETADNNLDYKFYDTRNGLDLVFISRSGILEISPTKNFEKTTLIINVIDEQGAVALDSIFLYVADPPLTEEPFLSPIPQRYQLNQNYPNPFNSSTIIKYDIPRTTQVQLVIYDILGKEIRRLVDGYLNPGSYRVYWDGLDQQNRPVASGVYVYQITAKNFRAVRKLVIGK